MKISVRNIITAVSLILAISLFVQKDPVIDPKPVEVKVPETSGSTGLVKVDTIKPKPEVVFIKGDTVEVDKGYKEKYELAKDSIERLNLYLMAIKIRDYKGVIVDNEDIKIEGEASVRGSLLDYKVDYTLKEKTITYKPVVITKLPKLSAGVGLEVGLPTNLGDDFLVKANANIMNSKGDQFNISIDTDERVWAGYTKNFKIIK